MRSRLDRWVATLLMRFASTPIYYMKVALRKRFNIFLNGAWLVDLLLRRQLCWLGRHAKAEGFLQKLMRELFAASGDEDNL